MLSVLSALLAVACAAAAPAATYDQRQEGEFNVRADVQNVVLLVAIPQKMPFNINMLEGFLKNSKQHAEPELQERADVQVMEAFVEPATPYRVDLSKERSAEGDGRTAEVVIAGRRSGAAAAVAADDDMKLLGATEQCGPGRQRDPASLSCREQPDDAADEPPPETHHADKQ